MAPNLKEPVFKPLKMNRIFRVFRPFRRLMWALIVAFMVGVHNFYKQEMDSPDSIVNSIEIDKEEEDSAPKD
ncbi:MAG: hypothetical protein C0433_18375 [Cyclobacterium sp.]|nr:hypothetical protein [Cyclobacterium sp.]